jgi:hypothetical protein
MINLQNLKVHYRIREAKIVEAKVDQNNPVLRDLILQSSLIKTILRSLKVKKKVYRILQ